MHAGNIQIASYMHDHILVLMLAYLLCMMIIIALHISGEGNILYREPFRGLKILRTKVSYFHEQHWYS